MKQWRAYLSIFRIQLMDGLQYRLAHLSGATVGIFWAILRIVIFRIFYTYADDSQAGMSLQQLVTYEWLAQTFWSMQAMSVNGEILDKIVNGNLGIEMCRPLDIYRHWFAKTSACRITPLLSRSFAILGVSLLMPTGYRPSPPSSPVGLLCGVLAFGNAFLLCTAYEMLVTAIRVGVTWGEGPTYILLLVGGVLSGSYFPLQMWPDALQPFLLLQPFAGYLDIPLRLYIGALSPTNAVFALGVQWIWILVFILLGRKIMDWQTSRIIIQGG